MSIIVTGGAGMIGSNIIEGLNKSGHNDIIVVDHLKNGGKFRNISDLDILQTIRESQLQFPWWPITAMNVAIVQVIQKASRW